jgi:hypothetical protein
VPDIAERTQWFVPLPPRPHRPYIHSARVPAVRQPIMNSEVWNECRSLPCPEQDIMKRCFTIYLTINNMGMVEVAKFWDDITVTLLWFTSGPPRTHCDNVLQQTLAPHSVSLPGHPHSQGYSNDLPSEVVWLVVCLTRLSQLFTLYSVEWKVDKWTMNWKVFGRKRSWPKLRYYPSIRLQRPKKRLKISVMIAGVQAEIWTRDTPNTNQDLKTDVLK